MSLDDFTCPVYTDIMMQALFLEGFHYRYSMVQIDTFVWFGWRWNFGNRFPAKTSRIILCECCLQFGTNRSEHVFELWAHCWRIQRSTLKRMWPGQAPFCWSWGSDLLILFKGDNWDMDSLNWRRDDIRYVNWWLGMKALCDKGSKV